MLSLRQERWKCSSILKYTAYAAYQKYEAPMIECSKCKQWYAWKYLYWSTQGSMKIEDGMALHDL